ncbi:MAG: TspO/MBR family protein [Bacillota bacterium]|nr:TspO/MBR family protein [Bacillota bacterium]
MRAFKYNLGLIASILIAEGVGYLSANAGMSGPDYYSKLVTPSFAPPAWVFPLVWVILYALMGTAAYRVFQKRKERADIRKAIVLYEIQLCLNFFWTIIFFKYKLLGAAFMELMILLVFILLTTFEFYNIDKKAAYLMLPYILWVSFAGVLNYSIYLLNR